MHRLTPTLRDQFVDSVRMSRSRAPSAAFVWLRGPLACSAARSSLPSKPPLAPRRSAGVFVRTRTHGYDWTKRYPWIAEAALKNRQKHFVFGWRGRDPRRGWRTVADMHHRTIAALEKSAKNVIGGSSGAARPKPSVLIRQPLLWCRPLQQGSHSESPDAGGQVPTSPPKAKSKPPAICLRPPSPRSGHQR